MSYVLDTNIVVAALNGHQPVVNRLNAVSGGEGILPAIALAELRYGALSSRRVAENMSRIDRILDFLVFVPVDRNVVERFGLIKADLRRSGLTKSDADLLIAATAIELDSILVTDDHALHDGSIDRLRVENWLRDL
jgi:tRNA(fMet)-specific endonuclease VapC